jgi:hypothetical protein
MAGIVNRAAGFDRKPKLLGAEPRGVPSASSAVPAADTWLRIHHPSAQVSTRRTWVVHSKAGPVRGRICLGFGADGAGVSGLRGVTALGVGFRIDGIPGGGDVLNENLHVRRGEDLGASVPGNNPGWVGAAGIMCSMDAGTGSDWINLVRVRSRKAKSARAG